MRLKSKLIKLGAEKEMIKMLDKPNTLTKEEIEEAKTKAIKYLEVGNEEIRSIR